MERVDHIRQRWNARHARRGQGSLSRGPRALLRSHAQHLPDYGLALDGAAGVIQNGLFLAEKGLNVLALDISEVGLRIGLRQARRRSLSVHAVVCDLRRLWLPPESFDVIVNLLYLERATLPVYRQALKPGGLLLFEGFSALCSVHARNEHYLKSGELLHHFQDFDILHHGLRQVTDENEEIQKQTEQLVARKPLGQETVSVWEES